MTVADVPALRGERVVLRPVREDDVAALTAILSEPDVRRWWLDYDADRVLAEFVLPSDADTTPLVIEVEGRVAGLIQFFEEDDPHFRHAGVDLFLGGEWQGRGLGPDAIRTLVRWLFDERGHHRIVIDPAAANVNAIRAYENVGFRPVGVMRRYTRAPDGGWEDGLMMDLLAGELR